MHAPPIAYFISFRTHGTWLHGDARGSVQHRPRGLAPAELPPMPKLERAMEQLLRGGPVRLDGVQRSIVTETIGEVCRYRGWMIHALGVRTEHVHVVVSATPAVAPERVMNDLKAWCTRRMAERGARARGAPTWSRHGSTRYLWSLEAVEAAVRYVEEQ